MRQEDRSFVEWACRRHTWLFRMAYGPRRFKSKVARGLAQRAAVAMLRIDRFAWRLSA